MAKETARPTIKDMREENRPRERLIAEGPQALSDGELLAVLLGSGLPGLNAIDLGNQILKELGGFSGIHRTDVAELQNISGVGLAKAARIKAAVELGNRLSKERTETKTVIRSPEDVVRLVGLELRGKEQEELWVIWLNVRNQVLGIDRLYKGSQDSSSVRVGEIFTRAIRKGANAVILVHNHPSGDASESPEDVNLTRAVVEAGRLLDMRVHDHIIIGREDFSSIKQNHPTLWV
ncbi:MAG: DNA repair protein RadC [Anaerolineaceae bacterium]|jgi:DNA repair protein RadC